MDTDEKVQRRLSDSDIYRVDEEMPSLARCGSLKSLTSSDSDISDAEALENKYKDGESSSSDNEDESNLQNTQINEVRRSHT